MAAFTSGAAAFRLVLGGAALLAACTSVHTTQATFENWRWQVAAINGQPMPRNHMYQMHFSGGRIAGRFGCNQFGGEYDVRGETLSADDVASTLIGCPEPAATHEAQGFAVLGRPMRIEWQSAQRLTLTNERGSIALERLD